MSRFPGWTSAAVAKLNTKDSDVIQSDAKIKIVKQCNTDYCGAIVSALKILGVVAVREYKFLHDRRFRFDIAIPEKKIAIEFEGGTFSNGRHTRGKGYSNDAKKYNLATMHGWKLLRYTSDRTNKTNWEFEIASEIKNLIGE